ncbi:HNH endonuclease signature motif containing protein [Phycicoccus flavus]|uniref:HNH endonuclease signature motif containing protein n=1 Tax=Phycicoccus flavus TaxID=2502783 RepID=UPI000FEBE2D7|nr:HNH endonuclease signature motif containing protein [Phycicoccus flavus]NHA67979.1 HNH endonuclease [Phycicoccus flavus]
MGERTCRPGRVSLDAADLVAPALGCSHAQAQRRVEQAVRVAAGRTPTETDDGTAPRPTGLDGLHTAMAQGRLDGYRASVVAGELEEAPAEVAGAVLAALDPHLHEDGAALRRRCRRVLARIAPDLLRERAVRARAATGLRRWAAEPGVDAWYGTFPSETAATAWAAIDRRAHDLVADGTCTSVEQARGRALTDLVTGNATIDVQVVLAVPADATHPHLPTAAAPGPMTTASTTVGARSAIAGATTAAATGPATMASTVETRRDTSMTAPATAAPAAMRRSRPEDLVQVHGARPGEPLLVSAGWLRDHLTGTSTTVACHPATGARTDPGDALTSDGYRPPERLAALVRARDGRCRFPGCAVAARFCDLDHVRPWPTGPTSAANLLCLCRRHHRIKQTPGWSVRLTPDGTATWTDPAGAVRTTHPLDALDVLVLRAADPPDPPPPTPEGPDSATSPPPHPPPGHPAPPTWSALECRLGLLVDRGEVAHRRLARAVGEALRHHPGHHRRHRVTTGDTDLPPF